MKKEKEDGLRDNKFAESNLRFSLGPSIASKIMFALSFANCDILWVNITRIDPLL